MTAPDWVPAMKKAKAIVTDAGGMTCHASIVSRELGIPCIVGTKSAASKRQRPFPTALKSLSMRPMASSMKGVVADLVKPQGAEAAGGAAGTTVVAAESVPVTGTKIYMNLGNPDLAEKYGALPCEWHPVSCVKNSFGRPSFMNIPYISSKRAVRTTSSTSFLKGSAKSARPWLRVR